MTNLKTLTPALVAEIRDLLPNVEFRCQKNTSNRYHLYYLDNIALCDRPDSDCYPADDPKPRPMLYPYDRTITEPELCDECWDLL